MAKKQLEQLAINEAMGDIPTHFMKSGSCMPPRDRLDVLAKFRERIIPEEYMGCPFEYDLWFNTNELRTIRAFLYTDFLGGGCFFRVNTIKINDRVMHSIADSNQKIDEDRIQKIIDNLENKYTLKHNRSTYDKVVFPPGSNLIQAGKNVLDWKKLDDYVMNKGFVIKPHPITAHVYCAKYKHRYGADKVLDKKLGGHEILERCTDLAFCPNSQMGIEGLLLGKTIHSVAVPRVAREKNHLTYEAIYQGIAGKDCGSRTALLKILSSKRSGIVFHFDNDAEERVERYLEQFWEYTFRPHEKMGAGKVEIK
jgi:hypothetical protein